MNEISISKICIKIGSVELELSPAEAKELRDVLNNLIGEQVVTYIPNTYPYPYRWFVTYCDNTATITSGSTGAEA